MQNIHLITAADLHLGRYVGLPNTPSPKSYAILAWERLVETCLQHDPKIDALLLAGDIIDKEGLFIEMYGVMKQGITRLLSQNISVIAVAGNHDAKVLNQLHKSLALPGFHLLGANGYWERKQFLFKDRVVQIDGLSFTESQMLDNPVLNYKAASASKDEILIGLLHCDLDARDSRYGPIALSDLMHLPHQAWVLGHIHAGKVWHQQNPLIQYCGSLQGLDITETGPKGAQLLTITPAGGIESRLIPLSGLRWEKIQIDLSEISCENWEGQVIKAIEEGIVQQIADPISIETIAVRIVLIGKTSIFSALRRELQKFQQQENTKVQIGDRWIPYMIESLENKTQPARNLEELALRNDFVGALANRLLQYQKQPAIPDSLFDQIYGKLGDHSFFKQCEQAWPSEQECRELYLRKGLELLDELMSASRS